MWVLCHQQKCNTTKLVFSSRKEEAEPVVEDAVEDAAPKPLVPIVLAKIGEQEVNSVSARDLYLDLGMDEKHWSRWQRRNIEENRFFSQGIDFIEITRRATQDTPSPPKDYAVTIEMAQHLAMMAKTQRAHDYRNYFIECEKVAKGEIQKVERSAEPIVLSNLRENLSEAVEIMMILGMPHKNAVTSALSIVKNSTGVDILALAGNPEI